LSFRVECDGGGGGRGGLPHAVASLQDGLCTYVCTF
jgi:hypothetical protein